MPLRLAPSGPIAAPVDGSALRPETLALAAAQAARLRVGVGNGSAELGELFRVDGDGSDGLIVCEGDWRGVRDLARWMASGRVEVRGEAGHGLGSAMVGGSIEVFGPAGDRVGSGMLGGLIRVRGPAGDLVGAAEPGSRVGMRDGTILVDGPAGDDVGLAMRRGLIAVGGRIGDGAARGMVAGSVFAFGPIGRGPAAGMKRGTLALFGLEDPGRPGLLPTFEPSGSFRPHVLNLYLKHLIGLGFAVPESVLARTVRRYNGDRVEGGRGEVWVAEAEGPR